MSKNYYTLRHPVDMETYDFALLYQYKNIQYMDRMLINRITMPYYSLILENVLINICYKYKPALHSRIMFVDSN